MFRPLTPAMAIACLFVVAACGGGGGDGTPATAAAPVVVAPVLVTSPTMYPVASVIQRVLTSGATFNAAYNDGSNAYTFMQTFAPAQDAAFQGVTRKQATSTVVAKRNGIATPAISQIVYFSVSPLTVYGTLEGSTTTTIRTDGALPVSAAAGASGPLWYGTRTNGSGASFGTQVSTWSVMADTATTALICLNSTFATAAGVVSTESDCYRVDASGATNGTGRFTGSSGGTTLTFQ